MKLKLFVFTLLSGLMFSFVSSSLAATVSCEVKEVDGAVLILENCDQKRMQDFKKGSKVKVKLQKKQK